MFSFLKRRHSAKRVEASLQVVQAMCSTQRPMLRKEDLDRINETHAALQEDIRSTKDQARAISESLSSELERAKMRASIISDSLMDPMIGVDAHGVVVSTNQTVERILGYTERDLLGKHINTLIHHAEDITVSLKDAAVRYIAHINKQRPVSAVAYRDQYRAYVNSDENVFLNKVKTVQCFTSDKRPLFAELHVNILNVDCESVDNMVFIVILHDNTKHIKVVTEVESLTQFQLSLLSALPNPVFYKDENMRIIGSNRAFEEFVGGSPADFIGKTNREIFTRPLSATVDSIDSSLKDSDSPDVQVHKLEFKTTSMNAVREVMLYSTALRSKTGEFKGILATIVDLTDLLSLHRFKEALVTSVPAPVYYLDKDFVYRGCNDKYVDLLGLEKEDLIGKSRNQVFPIAGDIANGVLSQIYRQKDFEIQTSLADMQSYETQCYNKKKGVFLDIMVYRAVLRAADGSFDGIVAVVTDVSEIRSVQRFHQRIFDSLPIPVFYKDRAGVYVACNDLYARWFKLSTPSIVGKTREGLYETVRSAALTDDGLKSQLTQLEATYKSLMGEHRSAEEYLMDSKSSNVHISENRLWNFELGEMRDVLFYRHALFSNTTFDGIICSMIDISELRRLESLKSTLLDGLPIAVCYVDFDGLVIKTNRSYNDMVGFDAVGTSIDSASLMCYHESTKLQATSQSGLIHTYCALVPHVKNKCDTECVVFKIQLADISLFVFFDKEEILCLNCLKLNA